MRAYIATLILVLMTVSTHAQYLVVDGDTVANKIGEIRLLGFDAPEIFHSRCPSEKALGLRAKAKLVELAAPPNKVRMSFQREKKSRQLVHDKYGRRLATMRSNGKDVGEILIASGLAVPYNGRGTRKNWCQQQ